MENRTLTTAIACLALVSLASAQEWREVTNPSDGYTVSLPADWTIWDPESGGALEATSYPENLAPGGGLIAPGGATLHITANRDRAAALDAWIEASSEYTEPVRRGEVSIAASETKDVRRYTEVEVRYDVAPGVYYRRVTDFFLFHGRLFAAQLEYAERTDRESYFRSVLNHVVRSIAATGPTAGRRN